MSSKGSSDDAHLPSPTHLTVETSRSLLTRILQPSLRTVRPHLIRFSKPFPPGSPKLEQHSNSKCIITEHLIAGVYMYDLTPNQSDQSTTSPHHHLYYFAGGGFQNAPAKEHWKFCAELATKLHGIYSVAVVSYPLAPNSPAEQALPILREWLRAVLNGAGGDSVTLMGDSAGGNIALTLGFWWAGQISRAQFETSASKLRNVFVMSPPTDLRNQNPDIHEADKHDPVLSKDMIEDVAKVWAGSLPRDDPQISPVLADFNALRTSKIKVHGVVGTFDVLAPDVLVFQKMCMEKGIGGEWLQWEKQMHCFPLTQMYGVAEGKKGIEWIIDVLKRNK